MLPNFYESYTFSKLNINLSSKVLGKRITINRNNKNTFNDVILERYISINNLKFKNLFQRTENLLTSINYLSPDDDLYLIVPPRIKNQTINDFNILTNDLIINSYYFDILEKRNKFTSPIKNASYDHHSSLTGRMKIVDGKNYLIMKKDKRMEEIEKDNILLELDIKSCEPALLHAVLYDETPEDVYSFFTNGFDDIPRNKIKIAVISSIYGSDPQKVKKLSGLSLTQIKNIHDHFQLKKIKEIINDEFNKKGYFFNMYGRPIYDNSSPVNYWLQSSAADYSCLAFQNFLERTKFTLKACIHDAIIIDVNEDQLNSIKKINKIFDPVSNIKLRIEQTQIK